MLWLCSDVIIMYVTKFQLAACCRLTINDANGVTCQILLTAYYKSEMCAMCTTVTDYWTNEQLNMQRSHSFCGFYTYIPVASAENLYKPTH